MRVLVVVFMALTIIGFSDDVLAATDGNAAVSFVDSTESESQSLLPFWKKKKKKKVKTSNRLKKRNRRMGKNFRRQNDDYLRR